MFKFKLYDSNGYLLATQRAHSEHAPVQDTFYSVAVKNGIKEYQVVRPDGSTAWYGF